MTLDRRALLAASAAALLAGRAASAEEAETASALVARESAQAAAEGKRVMLVFHASWCSWCKLMDAMLADPAAAKILAPRFRIVHLRVQERDDAERARELPGAEEVLARYRGAGLPFTAVLDGGAAAVATSAIDGENFGFPVKADELDAFEHMLKAAAPDMSAKDRAALRKICVKVMESA